MGLLARMRGLAARDQAVDRNPAGGLGTSALAVRAPVPATPLPPGAVLVETADGVGWLVHASPLSCHVTPFAAAPEIGLRLDYCFDASGERHRFALLLAAEAERVLLVESVGAAIQEAVQGALQLGTLELPPCTSDEEWHAFRAGLNELVYTRFGLVVEDCLPVDLHPAVDFAAQLAAAPGPAAAVPPAAASHMDGASAIPPVPADALPSPAGAERPAGPSDTAPGRREPWLEWVRLADMPLHGRRAASTATAGAAADAAALRRLFLELPALAAGLRALQMREGDGTFAPLQDILRRLALAAVHVSTMPSLAHSAPGQRLGKHTQQLRAAHAAAAQAALDESWALLAAMRGGLDRVRLDEFDRVLSNLEYSLAQRRATQP